MAFEQMGNLRNKPACVSKLKDMALTAQERRFGQVPAECTESFLLVDETGRELPEDDLEFLFQALSVL